MKDRINSFENQPQIYELSKNSKIFFSGAIIALGMLLASLPPILFFISKNSSTTQVVILFSISIGIFLFCFHFVSYIRRMRIETYSDKIMLSSFFHNRLDEIFIKDIHGYKRMPSTSTYILKFRIVVQSPKLKNIDIEFVFEQSDKLVEWFENNLTYLGEETEKPLEDKNLGENLEKRTQSFNAAKKCRTFVNILFAIIILCVFIFPYNNYAIFSLMIFPFLLISTIKTFNGAIKLDEAAHPNLSLVFIIGPPLLALHGFRYFPVLNWDNFWLPFTFCSLLLYILMLVFIKELKQKKFLKFFYFFICLSYGLGAITCLNGILDSSHSQTYNVEIIGKSISKGKSETYYFKVAPWKWQKEESRIKVNKEVYYKYQIGNTAHIIVKEGRLGIPWGRIHY